MQATRSLLFRKALIARQAVPVGSGAASASAPSASTSTGYFLATLPWKTPDERQRFKLTQGERLLEGVDVVASSIITSKRTSPIAGSLALRLDNLSAGGGAWVLLRATDREEAMSRIRSQFENRPVFDVERATLESFEGFNEANAEVPTNGQDGPLFAKATTTNPEGETTALLAASSGIDGVENNGPLYGK